MTERAMQDKLRDGDNDHYGNLPYGFASDVADRLDELETQNAELLKLVELVDAGANIIGKLEADKAELLAALKTHAVSFNHYEMTQRCRICAAISRGKKPINHNADCLIAKHENTS